MTHFLHSARWRAIWRLLARALLALALLGVLSGVALGAVIARYGARDHAAPADVIVVLGGGTEGTLRRTAHAIALYRQGYAPALLCTGGWALPGEPTEADRCAAAARAAGLPPDAVLAEDHSLTTEENARAAQQVMAARGWQTALIVTDDYHLWRAHWLFGQRGIHAYASPAQLTTGPLGAWDEAGALVREVLAVGWHVARTALGLSDAALPR